jgi:hypothetical protein
MAEVAIVPLPTQTPVVAVKPYCGAKRAELVKEVQLFKTVVPEWADSGVVSHMQAAVVPEDASKCDGVDHLKPKFQVRRWLFRFSVLILAVIENLLCYLAYVEVAPPKESFYNKFEAHMLGYPGIEFILLILAILNTFYLLAFWMMMALMRLDLYSSMTTGRLFISLPSGGVCTAMVFFGEGTKTFPFCGCICVLLHLLVWTSERIHPPTTPSVGVDSSLPEERSRSKASDQGKLDSASLQVDVMLPAAGDACGQAVKQKQNRKRCEPRIVFFRVLACLISGWCISLIVMFSLEAADYLYDKDCPATTNNAMPVRISGVHEWQCVKWGQPHYITRLTLAGEQIYDALCSTSFHTFNTMVNASTGEMSPSSGAHYVRCPAHCQELGLGNSVIGCKVYSATSSICSAAVQMGILAANAGGLVKVVGRAPPTLISGQYERCNQHGILSTGTPAPATTVAPDWAFYFQVAGMESLDMVTMHGWKKLSTPGATKPWESYAADVTWVVGGASERRDVVLGPGGPDADIELTFCRGSVSCT